MGREAKAQEVNLRLGQLKLQYQQAQSQARLYDMQMHAAQSAERVRAMGWNSSAYYAPPVSVLSFFPYLMGVWMVGCLGVVFMVLTKW